MSVFYRPSPSKLLDNNGGLLKQPVAVFFSDGTTPATGAAIQYSDSGSFYITNSWLLSHADLGWFDVFTLKNNTVFKCKTYNESGNRISIYIEIHSADYQGSTSVTIVRSKNDNNQVTFAFFEQYKTIVTAVGPIDTIATSSSSVFSDAAWNSLFNDTIAPPDPYGTETNDTPAGGYGPFDYTSEVETPPQPPSLSAAQVGFVSLWNPTQSEMQGLANYLWTGTFDLTNFKKLFTDPMECVLSVGIIPITPTREASKREIVFGGSSHSGVSAYAVTEQFYIVDMGTLHITGMSQGALDYSPYAKASIYLPYCGTYALDVDEIMNSDISLEYHIDIYTGACVAYLTIDGHVNSDGENVNAIMYQFTGNVLASIPITGNDHSQFIQSMLFMGAAAAATVATSGAGAGAAAGAGPDLGAETAAAGFNKALAGSAVNTVMSMKPNVLHSGNLSTTAGMLGGQKPFITMTWSNLCRPEDEYKLVGLPLHKSGTLSDFSGFTIVSACHMDNILCTDAELQMIEQALAKGVII